MTSQANHAYVSDDGFVFGETEAISRENFNNVIYGSGSTPIQVIREPSKSRQRYITVAILCFINLINYVDRFTIAGTLERVQTYYGLGNSEGGLLQTVFILSYMVMAPVFGYLGDRYSRKLIIACGVSFWSLTTLLGSFIPGNLFGIFVLLRALVGIGEASYSTIAPTIIGDLFSKDQRSKMLAIFYFAIPVGSGLGYIIGDQAVAQFGEWQWALRLTPILGAISVILTILYVKDPPRGEAEGGTTMEATTMCADLKDLYKTKSYVYSTLGFTSVTFATGALGWFAPKYIDLIIKKQSGGSAPPKAALVFGVITCIAGVVGVCIGSSASQYFRRLNPKADPLICAFGVLGSVPFIFFGVIVAEHQLTMSWILIFLGEVCLCVNWTIVADMLLYVVVPTRRSMAEAFQILIAHLFGDASSPYIIGLVSDGILRSTNIEEYLTLQYALYIPTGILVLGAFFFFVTSVYIEKDKGRCSFLTHDSKIVPKMPESCYISPQARKEQRNDQRCDELSEDKSTAL